MSGARRFWYPGPSGEPAGPLPADEIRERLGTGALRAVSPLCLEGTQEWRPAAEFEDFAATAPSYFYKRESLKMGPVELPELGNLVRVGELTASDQLMAKGTAEWVPLASIPALAAALAAAAAAPAAPARVTAPRASKPAAASPSRLKTVPYTPGARPSAPGPYLTYSADAVEVLALLEALKTPEAPPPPPPGPAWGLRLALGAGVLLLAGAAAAVDLALGFPLSPFTYLIPLALVGLLLIVAATGSPAPRPGWVQGNAGGVGCLSLAVGIPMVLALSTYALGSSLSVSPWAWLFAAVLSLVAAVLIDRRAGAHEAPDFELARVDDCVGVMEALEHDAMPGKPASGWLDLTGPQQASKTIREGRSASGAGIRVYRDEWWRLKLPLRDGNQLRISAVERWKVKDEVRKRRRTKPGSSERIATLEVKLGVNTAVYRTREPFTPATCGESLTPGPIQTAPDSVSTQAQLKGRSRFRPKDVLTLLALVYARLEPVKSPAGAAP